MTTQNTYLCVKVSNKLAGLLENPNIFADFEKLSYWETRFSNAVAIAVFIAWIKVNIIIELKHFGVMYLVEKNFS